jgi:hypothetical protein
LNRAEIASPPKTCAAAAHITASTVMVMTRRFRLGLRGRTESTAVTVESIAL